MKSETIFLMVRVQLQTTHKNITNVVRELENHAKLELSDTPNVNVLETEILISRVRNYNKIHRQREKDSLEVENSKYDLTEPKN